VRATIDVPDVPYPGGRTTAEFFRTAARNLRGRYSPGGSNLRDTIAVLLDRTAAELDAATGTTPTPPAAGDGLRVAPDGRPVADLTYTERKRLPAIYHQPAWLDLGRPRWVCRVCQDDDHADSWPCAPARRDGGPIAEYAGLNATG